MLEEFYGEVMLEIYILNELASCVVELSMCGASDAVGLAREDLLLRLKVRVGELWLRSREVGRSSGKGDIG